MSHTYATVSASAGIATLQCEHKTTGGKYANSFEANL